MEHPAPAHPAETTAPDTELYRLRWWAMLVLSLAIFVSAIDATIVNVALPSIVDDLDASNSDLQWIIDAYLIVLAGFVLFGGGLADRFGRRGIFLTGFAVFGLGSLLASFATSPGILIGTRVLMGLGAALLMPPALSILAVIFPVTERPRAIAIWAGVAGGGIALGPVAGGVLLDRFWWGSVFLVNVPVTVVGIVAGLVLVPTSRKPGGPRLDIVGAVLSVGGLAVLLYGVIEGPDHGWLEPSIVAALVIGAVVVACFIAWELRTPDPMFDVRVFRHPAVIGGGLAIFLVYLTFFGIFFLLPQYLQYVQRRSILVVGLAMLPFGLIFAVLSPFSARVTARFGVRQALTCGLVLMAIGLAVLSLLGEVGGYGLVLAGTGLYSVGWAAVMAPATTAVVNALPVAKAGDGSSVNQITRQVGGAFGVAIIGSIFAAVYTSRVQRGLSGASAAVTSAAEQSLGGAIRAASTLGGASGPRLAHDAVRSFDEAAQVGLSVAAMLALLGALVAARTVPSREGDDSRA